MTLSGLDGAERLKVGLQSFGYLLKHPLYAGRIRNDAWGIDVVGDFEPIVDEHTFFRVQAVLRQSKAAGKRHRRHNPDFPLRRFVRCGVCENPLTGGWSRQHREAAALLQLPEVPWSQFPQGGSRGTIPGAPGRTET